MKRSLVSFVLLLSLLHGTHVVAEDKQPPANKAAAQGDQGKKKDADKSKDQDKDKDKKDKEDPKNQVMVVTGGTEKGAAAGLTASFELPADSGLDMTVLVGQPLIRAHIGAEVVPIQILKREIKGKDGSVSYQLEFVPAGEFHLDVSSFKEVPDMHAFATPAMVSTIEFNGKSYKTMLKFLMSPAAMGLIRTDSGPVATFGGQTGIGVSVSFRVSPITTLDASVEATLYKNWTNDVVTAIDLDAKLTYTRKVGVGQYFSAGGLGQYEMIRINKPTGAQIDLDKRGFIGFGLGFAWSGGP